MKKALLLVIFLFPTLCFSQELGNFIIQNDISAYKFRPKPTKRIYNSGVLVGANHFNIDHSDITYETRYIMPEPIVGVEVQVTQHAGGDSDRWLLHEVEDSFRDADEETLGLLTDGVRMREINGNKIISLRGNGYIWVTNNIVVNVSYRDLTGTKPEPLEVIQAYLAKFHSTFTTVPDHYKSQAYNQKWIKDEMERRLWLCDKWNVQFLAGKVSQDDLLKELVTSMKVFLNYRQKYFNINATDDINSLSSYLSNKDSAPIQAKLSSYKTWWLANKTKAINL